MEKFVNRFETQLVGVVAISDTQIPVDDASGLGGISPGEFVRLVLDDAQNWEVVKCTAVSGNVLTVSRGEEGTSPRPWAAGTKVVGYLTAGTMADLQDQVVFKVKTITGDKTIDYTDWHRLLVWDALAPGTLTLPTISDDVFPPGGALFVHQKSSAGVKIVPSGVTINGKSAAVRLPGPGSTARLVKLVSGEWAASGVVPDESDLYLGAVTALIPGPSSVAPWKGELYPVVNGSAAFDDTDGVGYPGCLKFVGDGGISYKAGIGRDLLPPGNDPWTVEFFVKLDQDPQTHATPLMLKKTSEIRLQFEPGGQIIFWSSYNSTGYSSASGVLSQGVWQHVTLVYDTEHRVYVDGVLALTAGVTGNLESGMWMMVGDVEGFSGRSLYGSIAALRVTRGVARYTADFTPPTVPYPEV